MGTVENPSGDKFAPPPGEDRFEAPPATRSRAWYAIPLMILLVVARFELHHNKWKGWAAGAAGLAAFGLGIGEYITARKLRDQRRGEDPYTPPQHITR